MYSFLEVCFEKYRRKYKKFTFQISCKYGRLVFNLGIIIFVTIIIALFVSCFLEDSKKATEYRNNKHKVKKIKREIIEKVLARNSMLRKKLEGYEAEMEQYEEECRQKEEEYYDSLKP